MFMVIPWRLERFSFYQKIEERFVLKHIFTILKDSNFSTY